MGKLLGLFTGMAGGIAGLLPLAPWIIAAIVALVGAGGWFWKQHDLDAALADNAAKQSTIVQQATELGTVRAAEKVNEETISQMLQSQVQDDQLIDAQQHSIDENARASVDAGQQIRNLQNANADVAAFLKLPIPPALRSLLNHEPGSTTGASSANEDHQSTSAKAN